MRFSKTLKFFAAFLISILGAIILIFLILNLRFTQTWATKNLNLVFQKSSLPIRIHAIKTILPTRISVEGVGIFDTNGDTIVYAEKLLVKYKPLSLRKKRVILPSVSVENAKVKFHRNDSSNAINIAEVFKKRGKTKVKSATSKKIPWDVSVGKAELMSIDFLLSDSVSGTFIQEHVGKLSLKMDRMSLIDRTIRFETLEINESKGSIQLEKGKAKEESDSTSAWNIGFVHLKINESDFRYNNKMSNMLMSFEIGECAIYANRFDLTNKTIDLKQLYLADLNAQLLKEKKDVATNSEKKSLLEDFPWNLKSNSIEIKNIRFKTGGINEPITSAGSTAITISGMQTSLSNFKLNSDTTSVTIHKLGFDLSNGFSIINTSGKLNSYSGKTTVNLALETGNSLINLDGKGTGNLLNDIFKPGGDDKFSLSSSKTSFSLKDLLCFSPELQKKNYFGYFVNEPVVINGSLELHGTRLGFSGFSVSQANNYQLSIDGSIEDIFSPKTTQFILNYNLTDLNIIWLKSLLTGQGVKVYAPKIAHASVQGYVSNTFKSPEFFINIQSEIGNIGLQGAIDFNQLTYTLNAKFDKFLPGIILDNNKLGLFSGTVEINGVGFKPEKLDGKLLVKIDSLGFNNYMYTNAVFKASSKKSKYKLAFEINNPAVQCNLKGEGEFGDSLLNLNAISNFRAKLHDLNFSKQNLTVEGDLASTFNKVGKSIVADLEFTNIDLANNKIHSHIDKLTSSLNLNSLGSELIANSDFFTLNLQIEKPYAEIRSLIPAYRNYLESFLDTLRLDAGIRVAYLPKMKAIMSLDYHNSLEIFIPDSIIHFASISFELDNYPLENKLHYTILGNELEFKKFKIGTFNSHIIDSSGQLNLNFVFENAVITERVFHRISLTSHLSNRQGITELVVFDQQSTVEYQFKIGTRVENKTLVCEIPGKQLTLNKANWEMDSPDFFSYFIKEKRLVPNLKMHTNESSLSYIHTKINGKDANTLDFINVSIASLLRDDFVPGKPVVTLFGTVNYSTKTSRDKTIDIALKLNNGSWSDIYFNQLSVDGIYRSDSLKDYLFDITAVLDTSTIYLKGIKPVNEARTISATFENLPVHTFQPFVKNTVSDLEGKISGSMDISTANAKENLNGEIDLDEMQLRVNALNTKFLLTNQKVILSEKKMFFNEFKVLDSLHNELFVDGFIDLSNRADITSDLDITSSRLQVMNTTEKDNSSFFGNIFIDSHLSIEGPLKKPELKGNIKLTSGTEVFYKQMENLNLSESEKLIIFVNNTIPEKKVVKPLKANEGSYSNTSIETVVEIDPTTKLNFNLTNKLYKIDLNIQGGALLKYSMLSNNRTNLSGEYSISEGGANLKMVGWPAKTFKITKGGFIRWNNKIDDPELNFEAQNKVRSSYTNPVDGKERNVDFIVSLKLKNKLSELEVLFTIFTPDQYLMSIINTLSPEEQMRQAITILLFEKIDLPGISTSTNYMTEQVNSILESQMNQLTKTTIKDVDISFGLDTYTSATQSGAEQTKTSFSYEVKKDILNNRAQIEFSGRFNDYSNQQSSKNMSMNNFSFEYKLDSTSNKFIKVYSEHSYEDIFEGEIVKTGAGFTYRKSYNRVKDIWLSEDRKKKPKQPEK